MRKWKILLLAMFAAANVFWFLFRFERVVMKWEPLSGMEAGQYEVFYGPASRHPWWDDYEEVYYEAEQKIASADRLLAEIRTEMEGTDDPARTERLEQYLAEAQRLRSAIEKYRRRMQPYPSKKVVSGEECEVAFWVRRGRPFFTALRAIGPTGITTPLSEEAHWTKVEDELTPEEKGVWI